MIDRKEQERRITDWEKYVFTITQNVSISKTILHLSLNDALPMTKVDPHVDPRILNGHNSTLCNDFNSISRRTNASNCLQILFSFIDFLMSEKKKKNMQ